MKPRYLFLALTVVLVCSYASPQWVQTNGPRGGEPTDRIAIIPDPTGRTDLLASTQSGIFLSTDKGTTWTPVNDGIPKDQFGNYCHASCFAFSDDGVNGENIYAGFSEVGVYRSTNNGTSWIMAGSGLRYESIVSLAVSGNGTGGSSLFATTYYKPGFFCSTNNGASWRQINLGLTSQVVSSLAVIPNGESGNTILAGTAGAGIFRSTNDGTSWTEVNSGIQNAWTVVTCFAVSPNEHGESDIFAATNDGVYHSTNNGSSWTLVGSGSVAVSSLVISMDGKGRTNLFAGNYTGVFRSTDEGVSWARASRGLTNSNVMSLAICDDGHEGTSLFAGTDGGVFRSTDYGASWASANSGLGYSYSTVGTLVVSASGTAAPTLIAGTSESGVFLSSNNGISWTAINSGLGSPQVKHLAVGRNSDGTTSSRLIASTWGGVFISADNGLEWHGTSVGPPYGNVNSVATGQNATGGENIYAATMKGVFRSSNSGESWNRIDFGLSDTSSYFVSTTPNATGGTNLWTTVCTGFGVGRLFLSTNDGTNWSSTALQNPYICSIVAIGKNVFASSGGDFGGGGYMGGIFLSTDDGESWKTVAPWRVYTLAVVPNAAGDTDLFAGTYETDVVVSSDLGASWQAVSVGLPQTYYGTYSSVRSLAVLGQYLYAAPQTGVWRRPLSEMLTSVAPRTIDVPSELSLEQNYPNPFNPSTVIRYGLPARSHVSLTVFNTLGQQVSVLQSEEQDPGFHEVRFDGANLPSGVYFYRMQAGGYMETKRLLLLR